MVRHICGYEAEIFCKKCGRPMTSTERGGLWCPHCGRKITIVCPGCGKRW
ncbi:MAG: DNA helicase PriA [Methanoculleus sp. SDB]|nr:MAG: DNA helicase PriA [Methanoculleus sp. SDB]